MWINKFRNTHFKLIRSLSIGTYKKRMNTRASNMKKTNILNLLLITTSEQNRQSENIADLFLFLLRYSFLLNDTSEPQNSCAVKSSQFPTPQGNIYMGARYLDPKYSRWISVDPALGEYIPAAGKGNSENAVNLPGMGGIYNSENGNLYHYAGNDPVKYVDPDGKFIVMIGGCFNAGAGVGAANNTGAYLLKDDTGCWYWGVYSTISEGAVFGTSRSAGIEVTLAPFATQFSDIEGFSTSVGGSISLKVISSFIPSFISGGLEFGFNPDASGTNKKIKSLTASVSVTVGKPGTLGEVHQYSNWTFKINQWKIAEPTNNDEISEKIYQYLIDKDYEGLRSFVNSYGEERK